MTFNAWQLTGAENMKFNINDIGGNIAKQDDRYIVKDNTSLKNLVVSSTHLKSRK